MSKYVTLDYSEALDCYYDDTAMYEALNDGDMSPDAPKCHNCGHLFTDGFVNVNDEHDGLCDGCVIVYNDNDPYHLA